MSKKKNSQEQENNEELILSRDRQARFQQDEEVERAREFWDNNKSGIIGGVVLGLAVVLGYNYWQSYKLEQGRQASATYSQLVEQINQQQDEQKRQELAEKLLNEHASSSYSVLGAMQLAKNAVENKQFAQAQDYLSQAIESTDDETLANIARVRLASVMLQLEKYDEVINMLESQPSSSFSAQYKELIGDAYGAKGDIENAKKAYQEGIDLLTENGAQPGTLKIKKDALN